MSLDLYAEDVTLGKKLLSKWAAALEDTMDEHQFVDSSQKVFSFILKLANTVQSTSVIHSVKVVAQSIITKIRELVASSGDDQKAEG